MRALWVGGCLASGCLAKPGAPLAGSGSDAGSGSSSDAMTCAAPKVHDGFDTAGNGCGTTFTAPRRSLDVSDGQPMLDARR